ncbi:Hsc70-interacting protein [Forsythia ovata]|uniref:Hsc70-interacting protein n=1 Tax=Forsythia ovata TaxID=205694 RepID=A0ABD1WDA3_9LAMI
MDSSDIVRLLDRFIAKCRADPTFLSDNFLDFFRDYIESLRGKIPESAWGTEGMGDLSIEVTEENRNAFQQAKIQAMEAISEDNLEEAIKYLTMAILLNPKSANMYSTRNLNAAIRDAIAAPEINPDSAASKMDYDEEISVVLKKVDPNAHKFEEHHRKYERLRKEQEYRKIEHKRVQLPFEARAAYQKVNKQELSSSSGSQGGMPGRFLGGMPGDFPGSTPGGFPGGMPGFFPGSMPGGMHGNIDYNKILKILNNPELMVAFKDPEVMAALEDVMKNPASLAKHQANPKVAPVIAKILSKPSKL